ncbi:uncharacterized protein LOC115398831 [Salarias fasciatus]|uniref:uncharacterized protein LOC115398831 n=1 Tax=Salarias fasciatus TaxID=181472 RepID=UPI0011766DAF|nr:uncharacterized protein LOC115398831 [Salarias fasciatus]
MVGTAAPGRRRVTALKKLIFLKLLSPTRSDVGEKRGRGQGWGALRRCSGAASSNLATGAVVLALVLVPVLPAAVAVAPGVSPHRLPDQPQAGSGGRGPGRSPPLRDRREAVRLQGRGGVIRLRGRDHGAGSSLRGCGVVQGRGGATTWPGGVWRRLAASGGVTSGLLKWGAADPPEDAGAAEAASGRGPSPPAGLSSWCWVRAWKRLERGSGGDAAVGLGLRPHTGSWSAAVHEGRDERGLSLGQRPGPVQQIVFVPELLPQPAMSSLRSATIPSAFTTRGCRRGPRCNAAAMLGRRHGLTVPHRYHGLSATRDVKDPRSPVTRETSSSRTPAPLRFSDTPPPLASCCVQVTGAAAEN